MLKTVVSMRNTFFCSFQKTGKQTYLPKQPTEVPHQRFCHLLETDHERNFSNNCIFRHARKWHRLKCAIWAILLKVWITKVKTKIFSVRQPSFSNEKIIMVVFQLSETRSCTHQQIFERTKKDRKTRGWVTFFGHFSLSENKEWQLLMQSSQLRIKQRTMQKKRTVNE